MLSNYDTLLKIFTNDLSIFFSKLNDRQTLLFVVNILKLSGNAGISRSVVTEIIRLALQCINLHLNNIFNDTM